MPETLILSAADIRAVLSMSEAVAAVELAFSAHALGRAQMPAKVYLTLDDVGGDFRAMPSVIQASNGHPAAAGVKWVNSHPDNPTKHGLPAVMGVYVLSDPATAVPLAVMDATVLTAARTGAAAAVASRHLARKNPKSLGFVGCGVQARTLLSAHRVVYGDTLELLASDSHAPARDRFAAECGARAVSIEQASAADIVCTSTPGREPAILSHWLRNGTHINAMGADAPGKQELETAALQRCRIVIDEHHQATHSGEINVPLASGELSERALFGTLGEIIAGRLPFERRESDLTLFDSTGLAIQDVALARVLFARARDNGVGIRVPLVG